MSLFSLPTVEIKQNGNGLHEYFEVAPDEIQKSNIEFAVESILRNIGEDPEREGLLKTPKMLSG